MSISEPTCREAGEVHIRRSLRPDSPTLTFLSSQDRRATAQTANLVNAHVSFDIGDCDPNGHQSTEVSPPCHKRSANRQERQPGLPSRPQGRGPDKHPVDATKPEVVRSFRREHIFWHTRSPQAQDTGISTLEHGKKLHHQCFRCTKGYARHDGAARVRPSRGRPAHPASTWRDVQVLSKCTQPNVRRTTGARYVDDRRLAAHKCI
jgi:hypothetical protein